MKKRIAIALLLICLLTLAGCAVKTEVAETEPAFAVYRVPKEEASGFSYEEEAAVYLSENVEFAGETEIKQNGFYNITKCDITDTVEAYEQAKMECTISYDRVSIFYDSTMDMWKIYFFTAKTNGSSGDRQLVYMDGDGITRLVVNHK